MELTVKRKVFLENLPGLVEKVVSEYGIRLRRIVIEEDEKGCYTVLVTYESSFKPPQ